MLANKVRPKIQKVINRFPTKAGVYREGTDKYGQPIDEVFVCDVTGFYHEENGRVSIALQDKGRVTAHKPRKLLMVLIDPNASQMQKNDTLYLLDKEGNRTDKFVIDDLGDLNRMGIYYDLLLGEVN